MLFRYLVLLSLCLSACQSGQETQPQQDSPMKDEPATPGGQQAAAVRDCFWSVTVDDAAVNTLYPDIYAKYWVAALPLLPGTQVRLRGQFPHARYMSFNLYDPLLRPVDALSDRDILADTGSTNPFLPGAGRIADERHYAVNIISAAPPESGREDNTLYAHLPLATAGDLATPYAILIYRIYVPDNGRDRAGDMPLPRIELQSPDGTVYQGPEACEALEPFLPSTINEEITDAAANLPVPTGFGAFARLSWLKFFGLQSSTENRINATPARDAVHALVPNPANNSGGFASNIDNQYIYAALNQDHGPLAVFEAQMPQAPRTTAGQVVMEQGDMRYWSVCTYEIATQRYYDCLYDENALLDGADRGVFLVGREADRPANATRECGVNWLPWGPLKNSLIIMRHMLPETTFPHAIQRIPSPSGSCEAPVMGDYFPYGEHLDKAAFEALGCPVDPAQIANRASQFEPTEDCPQTPAGEVDSLGQP